MSVLIKSFVLLNPAATWDSLPTGVLAGNAGGVIEGRCWKLENDSRSFHELNVHTSQTRVAVAWPMLAIV